MNTSWELDDDDSNCQGLKPAINSEESRGGNTGDGVSNGVTKEEGCEVVLLALRPQEAAKRWQSMNFRSGRVFWRSN